MRLGKECKKTVWLVIWCISFLMLLAMPVLAEETAIPENIELTPTIAQDSEGRDVVTGISVTYQNTSPQFLAAADSSRVRIRYRLSGGTWYYAESDEQFRQSSDYHETETVVVLALEQLKQPEDCPGYEALKEALDPYTKESGDTGVCFSADKGTLEVSLRYESESNAEEEGNWSDSVFYSGLTLPEDAVTAYAARRIEEESGDAVEICFALSDKITIQNQAKLYVQMDCAADDEAGYLWKSDMDTDETVWESPFLHEVIQSDPVQQRIAFRFADEEIASLFAQNVLKTSEQNTSFQWETHTLLTRIRLVAVIGDEEKTEQYVFSQWSDTFALGKEATVMTKPEQITAPVITSAELSEYGDAKTLSVLLAVNDDAKQADVWMRLNEAGPLYAHMEISINGSEWESLAKCLVSNVKVPQTIDLSDVSVPDFALIRLRAVLGAEDVTAFPVEAEWSEAVGVNLIPDNITEIPSDVQTEREPESDTGMGAFSAENRKTCSVCHLCGQPFGICLFVLGGVVCAVLLVVICLAAALKAGKKKCPRCGKRWNKRVRICGKCGFRFAGALLELDESQKELRSRSRNEKNMSGAPKSLDSLKNQGEIMKKDTSQTKRAVRDIKRNNRPSDRDR